MLAGLRHSMYTFQHPNISVLTDSRCFFRFVIGASTRWLPRLPKPAELQGPKKKQAGEAMASFESNVLVFFAIVGLVSAFLVGVATAADAPAPEPASGTFDILAPIAAAVLLCTAAFFGTLRG